MVELSLIEGGVGKGAGAGTDEPATLARVYGRPLHELPGDLYIPPEALEVFLESFEGPLDLLLYLIRKHNLDVLDIPMADLTRQYLGYVEGMRHKQLELAAEYLLMAALLIEIKSRMLLPKPSLPDVEGEVEDPRAELVRRILEYEQMKLAGERIGQLPQAGRDYLAVKVAIESVAIERLPDVDPEDLRQAWLGLVSRARIQRHHRVTREQLSVREHMTRVLRILQDRVVVEFRDLFSVEGAVPELVVTFLAILELAKECLVSVTQQATFAPIYVRSRHATNTD